MWDPLFQRTEMIKSISAGRVWSSSWETVICSIAHEVLASVFVGHYSWFDDHQAKNSVLHKHLHVLHVLLIKSQTLLTISVLFFVRNFWKRFTSENNANQEITFIFVMKPRTKQVNPMPDSFWNSPKLWWFSLAFD